MHMSMTSTTDCGVGPYDKDGISSCMKNSSKHFTSQYCFNTPVEGGWGNACMEKFKWKSDALQGFRQKGDEKEAR